MCIAQPAQAVNIVFSCIYTYSGLKNKNITLYIEVDGLLVPNLLRIQQVDKSLTSSN